MSNKIQKKLHSDLATPRDENSTSHRRRAIRVLFICHDAAVVDHSRQELTKAHFVAAADVVSTHEQGAEQILAHAYDVIVAEYPGASSTQPLALQLLRQTAPETPLLLVTTSMSGERLAELVADGAFDYVEREHLGQLPMAVRRALNEQELRAELDAAGKALRHSESLYRALVDNPDYGICRCDAKGKILDANRAFLTMLGYATKSELLAANIACGILHSVGGSKPLPERSPESVRIEPVEMEWTRKNGTTVKTRLGGHAVFDDGGNFAGHEIIAVDITEQRALEDHLRHQAMSDSLTGLANHRRLFEVLHAEISRSERTKREFSLLLLDLDRLKDINDRFGHSAGDKALCRLARIMIDCCRSVDTAARQGGDEFALVLPETAAATALLVASRIRNLLEHDAQLPPLSVSVGVASYPSAARSIGDLLQAADRALYRMKAKQTRAAHAGQR